MTQAIELLEKAADVDKRFLAKLRLQQGEADKALEDLKSYADSHPGETLPLAYLAELQEAAGHTEEAQKSLERLRDLATEPDLDAVPFARLAPIAARLGWPAEWNKPASPADDVGQRPALDDLGPFRWQPSPAPQWTLVSATGENVSLSGLPWPKRRCHLLLGTWLPALRRAIAYVWPTDRSVPQSGR